MDHSSPPTPTAPTWGIPDRYKQIEAIPFALAHVACFAAIWTGVSWSDIGIAAGLYALRMFAITAGYHRYFSHRAFKTGRIFQALLAFVAQTSAQRGALWWASKHRHHHRHSDSKEDVHSPIHDGFWHSHFGWFFTERHAHTDHEAVRDFAKFPELQWLDRHPHLPPILLGVVVWALAGWSGLIVGFFWSTVALWHATFSINSLAHVIGRRRYVTGDESRNNWWLALLTFGEGWHNNHHHFRSAARQGFHWYEVDASYYVLKALAAVGLVWDLRTPPAHIVRAEHPLRPALVEKSAIRLAASFQIERIVADLRLVRAEGRAGLEAAMAVLHGEPIRHLDDLRHRFDDRVESIRRDLEALFRSVHVSPLPSLADLHARATAMFARSPSTNAIVDRARQIVIEGVCDALIHGPRPVAART